MHSKVVKRVALFGNCCSVFSTLRQGFTYLFILYLAGLLTLTLLLGSFLLTEGVLELFLAFRLRSQQNWSWVLADGTITLGLGGLVWIQWPSDASWVIGMVVGISIVSTGISRLMLSFKPPTTLEQSDSPVSS